MTMTGYTSEQLVQFAKLQLCRDENASDDELVYELKKLTRTHDVISCHAFWSWAYEIKNCETVGDLLKLTRKDVVKAYQIGPKRLTCVVMELLEYGFDMRCWLGGRTNDNA